MGVIVEYLLMTLLCVTSVFLILLVLVQRGRGGGLAGAFGGAGGQSAFGTKAGDVFTRVTIVVAAIWIVLCAASVKLLGSNDQVLNAGASRRAPRPPAPKARKPRRATTKRATRKNRPPINRARTNRARVRRRPINPATRSRRRQSSGRERQTADGRSDAGHEPAARQPDAQRLGRPGGRVAGRREEVVHGFRRSLRGSQACCLA